VAELLPIPGSLLTGDVMTVAPVEYLFDRKERQHVESACYRRTRFVVPGRSVLCKRVPWPRLSANGTR
jgi:hypothetical protein